jgi:hypothetical protein
LIDHLKSNYPNIGIKINTLVSQKNKDTVIGIGSIVRDKAATWKLSQFIDGGFGFYNKQDFEIDTACFKDIVKKCMNLYPDINILPLKAEKPNDYCRIISSNGHLMKPDKNQLIDLGRFISLEDDAVRKDFSLENNNRYLNKAYQGA